MKTVVLLISILLIVACETTSAVHVSMNVNGGKHYIVDCSFYAGEEWSHGNATDYSYKYYPSKEDIKMDCEK